MFGPAPGSHFSSHPGCHLVIHHPHRPPRASATTPILQASVIPFSLRYCSVLAIVRSCWTLSFTSAATPVAQASIIPFSLRYCSLLTIVRSCWSLSFRMRRCCSVILPPLILQAVRTPPFALPRSILPRSILPQSTLPQTTLPPVISRSRRAAPRTAESWTKRHLPFLAAGTTGGVVLAVLRGPWTLQVHTHTA